MKYHAKIFYGLNDIKYWSNWEKETLLDTLIIPFINGQVIYSKTASRSILNLRNVTRLKVYRTKKIIGHEIAKERIDIMKSDDFEEKDCTKEILEEAKINTLSRSTTSILQKSFAEEKNQVFVIMKFGDKILDSAYEGVIKPLFKENEIDVVRVDELEDSGKISDQILELIAESKFIFSDLSGKRPNCYYETGFSHALGKEIILSINSKDKIHFDLASHRFIQWETESELRRKLKKRIKALLEKN